MVFLLWQTIDVFNECKSGATPPLQMVLSATKGATDAFSNVGRQLNITVSVLWHNFHYLCCFYPAGDSFYKLTTDLALTLDKKVECEEHWTKWWTWNWFRLWFWSWYVLYWICGSFFFIHGWRLESWRVVITQWHIE